MTEVNDSSVMKRNGSDIAPFPPPDVLIHLHIAKTGGTSLSSMVKHGFGKHEIFEWTRHGVEVYSGVGQTTLECCEQQLKAFGLQRVRYVAGHVPIGVHRIFDRPARYITTLRHPVDRIISYFYFRKQLNDPFIEDGRIISLEKYVERRWDINLNDYQVRVVSGCPDLDAEAPKPGGQVNAAPVQSQHLEIAKRNIEELFLSAAPLEQLTEQALLLRRIYGWPMRRLQTEYKNPTKDRPPLKDIPARLVRIIEDCNSYDMELYEWVRKRFAEQRRQFEPELSRDRRIYGLTNQALTVAGGLLPWSLRKRLAELLFYAR